MSGGVERILNKSVFPSLQRRGGRAIKKMTPKATKVGADGVVSPRRVFEIDHPVCANKERDHFLDGAASPPLQGGEYALVQKSSQTLRSSYGCSEDGITGVMTLASGNTKRP